MYPSKGHLLHAKWNTFKARVGKFYANNIRNDYCKQLFSKLETTANIGLYKYI